MGKKKQYTDTLVGGQAIIEGVMMKGRNWIGIAVRKENNKIKLKTERFVAWKEKFKPFGWPFIRGFFNLLQMMVIGIKALNYSANEAFEEDEKDNKKESKSKKTKESFGWLEIMISMVFAFGIALVLFKFVPLFSAQIIADKISFIGKNSFLFSLVDGIIKISIFILYVYIISFMKDIKRVFQYHGAEHCIVYCYEAKKKLTVANARKYRTEHPRCGTSFIIGVLIISVFVYSFIPMETSFLMKYVLRILLLPVIMGISYEVLKISAKHKDHILFRIITAPGLWTQKITTRKPDNKQTEVAIEALKAVLKKEKINL